MKKELREYCNKCGRGVFWGSGSFLDRVIDLDDFQTRVDNGKLYPEGDFICSNCNSGGGRIDRSVLEIAIYNVFEILNTVDWSNNLEQRLEILYWERYVKGER